MCKNWTTLKAEQGIIMKKITTLTILGLSAIVLAACSSNSSSKKDSGASETKTEQQTTVASKI